MAATLLTWGHGVVGCDLCAIYSAAQARGELGRGPFAGVAEQFTHLGTLQEDGVKVENPAGQFLNSSISQLYIGYDFSDRVGVQFNAPIIYRNFKRPDGFGGIQRGSVAGIGDVSLLGNFVAWRYLEPETSVSWTLLGGVKFPTGSTERLSEEFNEVEEPVGPPSAIHGHDLTLGSGSFDGVLGSGIFASWHRLFLTANVQYAIRTEGDFTYRFANDVTWSGGPGAYVVLAHEYTLGVQAVVSGEAKGKDEFAGAPAEDTAITAVYLGPQLSFTWKSKLSAFLAVDVPVSLDNSALQIVPDYRLRAGLSFRF